MSHSPLFGLKARARQAHNNGELTMNVSPSDLLRLFKALDDTEQRVAGEIREAFKDMFEGKPMTADRASMYELTRGMLNREVQIRTPMKLHGSSQETAS